MNNPTQLLPTDLILVEVPITCNEYAIERSQDNFNLRQLQYQSDFYNGYPNYDRINLGESDFEILGEVTADSISFDAEDAIECYDKTTQLYYCFERNEPFYHNKKDTIYSLLQSNGIFFANPIDRSKTPMQDLSINCREGNYEPKIKKWHEHESKLVKKLIILKKV